MSLFKYLSILYNFVAKGASQHSTVLYGTKYKPWKMPQYNKVLRGTRSKARISRIVVLYCSTALSTVLYCTSGTVETGHEGRGAWPGRVDERRARSGKSHDETVIS
jgi:hypothetical protein